MIFIILTISKEWSQKHVIDSIHTYCYLCIVHKQSLHCILYTNHKCFDMWTCTCWCNVTKCHNLHDTMETYDDDDDDDMQW